MTWLLMDDMTVEPIPHDVSIREIDRMINDGARVFAHLEGCRRAGSALTPVIIRAEKVYSGAEIIANDWSVSGLNPVGVVVNVFNDGVNPPKLVSSRIIAELERL